MHVIYNTIIVRIVIDAWNPGIVYFHELVHVIGVAVGVISGAGSGSVWLGTTEGVGVGKDTGIDDVLPEIAMGPIFLLSGRLALKSPNKKERLLALPLLRTVRETFASYGSSIL